MAFLVHSFLYLDLHAVSLTTFPIYPVVHHPPGRCVSTLAEMAGGCPSALTCIGQSPCGRE
jgi:hypothetical protein